MEYILCLWNVLSMILLSTKFPNGLHPMRSQMMINRCAAGKNSLSGTSGKRSESPPPPLRSLLTNGSTMSSCRQMCILQSVYCLPVFIFLYVIMWLCEMRSARSPIIYHNLALLYWLLIFTSLNTPNAVHISEV